MKVLCTLVFQKDDGYEKVHEIGVIRTELSDDLVEYRDMTTAHALPVQQRVTIEGVLHRTTERKTEMPEDKKLPAFVEAPGGAVYGPSGKLVLDVNVTDLTTVEATRVMRIVLNALNALNAHDWRK